jgi:hypothetical protein
LFAFPFAARAAFHLFDYHSHLLLMDAAVHFLLRLIYAASLRDISSAFDTANVAPLRRFHNQARAGHYSFNPAGLINS